ncbi:MULTISPECIES: RloB family protein [Campylobacter]|uniref:RloB family protein n=1 Tax=Campylobacter TaxID=194 RepID=UPI0021BE3DB7|nr:MULTISPECIES: RloB family protein [Campylobacter]MCV3356118.1 RloB family protein [Campylobacter sp. RKI_CA19_01122]
MVYKRPKNNKSKTTKFLIICEGEKTEIQYFENFKKYEEVNKLSLIVNCAKHPDPNNILQTCINKKTENEYEESWIVFDRDERRAEVIDIVKKDANQNNIRVAYSNPCFELWYYLHFCLIQSEIDCKTLCEKLKKYFGEEYQKNKNYFDKLENKTQIAINNAKKLQENSNPYTNIYELVEKLIPKENL